MGNSGGVGAAADEAAVAGLEPGGEVVGSGLECCS